MPFPWSVKLRPVGRPPALKLTRSPSESAAETLKLRQAIASGKLSASGGRGVPVHLKLDDGVTYPIDGRLQFADVTVDQTTGSVTLRALFPNPRGFLLPGLYVRAVVVEGVDPNGILVPQRAVTRNEKGQPSVFVVGPGGKVHPREITTGRTVGDKWLVTSGLAAADRVIVDGLQDLARQGYLQLGYDTAATCWIRGRARDQSDAGG